MRNGKRVGPLKGYSCQLIVDDAIRWLDEKKNPDQPFFMNMWFNEPHSKLAAPDEITSIYGDLKDEGAIYSATVDNTDRAIGRLVAKLKETGKLDNTLIIYSSDHGSYRADRNGGLTGAKGSKFEGGLRSPGIFFWPNGFRGGRTEDTPSGSVDLLPTICGLTGIDKPKGVHLDGADLSPLLIEKGDLNRSQPLLWLSPSSGHLATLREGDYTLMGYSDYKLPANNAKKNELQQKLARLAGINPRAPNLGSRVTNTTFSSPEYNRLKSEFVRARTFQEAWIPTIKAGGFSRFELYDLKTDPQQKKDISKQRPKVTESLKKELLALYKDIMADAPDWSAQTGTENKQGKAKQNPEKGQRVQSSPQDILKKISQRPIPRGYRGSNHQSYVDERMKKLSPKQRTRLGELWKKASTEQNEGVNKGQLFVKILDYVQSSGKQHKSEDTLTRNDTFADSNYQFPREQKAFLEKTKRYWHQWRGPEATGMSATASPPVTWSEENNIRWKVQIEGQENILHRGWLQHEPLQGPVSRAMFHRGCSSTSLLSQTSNTVALHLSQETHRQNRHGDECLRGELFQLQFVARAFCQ